MGYTITYSIWENYGSKFITYYNDATNSRGMNSNYFNTCNDKRFSR